MPSTAGTPAPGAAWWGMPARDAIAGLGTSRDGLSAADARARLERTGPNQIMQLARTPAWRIIVRQLQSVVVGLLAAAAVAALVLHEPLEAAVIAGVIVINVVLGATMELGARRAMESLLLLDPQQVTVRRDGHDARIDARELVPGDVIVVEGGDRLPTDARLIDAAELRVDESALTGESLPVAKHADAVVHADTPLPERVNMLYKGTTVVTGRAHAVATSTGMATELGRIGGLLQSVPEEPTPLEHRLDDLGRRLVVLTLAIVVVVTVLGWARGQDLYTVLATGVALGVAAIPEGLPAVAAVTLALGLRRMSRRRAIVRRLHTVETLGAVSVVCTDKTGTLTRGEMTVTRCLVDGVDVAVSGAGYEPRGTFSVAGKDIDPAGHPALADLLRSAALASRADVTFRDGAWRVSGDPTDAALHVLARKANVDAPALMAKLADAGELTFSSERLFSAVFVHEAAGIVAHVKGAPRRVLEHCDRWRTGGDVRPMTDADRAGLLEQNHELANAGLRVIALASGTVERADERSTSGLTFLGFVGLMDPPANGVAETIAALQGAGTRIVMLTGDQRGTAIAVAGAVGLLRASDEVIDGRALSHLGDEELAQCVGRTAIFARISPEDKLRIVAALQRSGAIIAMLGDGINDAPALRKAHVGVAMGGRGTDVAKEAAGVVLQDDRFATIAAAVEEGRIVFDNIRKFVFYLFSCNLAEILMLFAATAVGLPLPLLPAQLLWLNLVTDTAPALSLAFEPAEPGLMRRPPRDPTAGILSARFIRAITFYALLIAAVSLAAFVVTLRRDDATPELARTVGFMTLALAQLFHLGTARSVVPVIMPRRAIANGPALIAVVLVIVAQLAAVYWIPLAQLLGVAPLGVADWILVIALAAVPAIIGQFLRFVRRGRPGRGSSPPREKALQVGVSSLA